MSSFPRMHVSLYVADITKTVAFYKSFFNVEPIKVKDDYAKFILDKLDLKMKIKFDNRYPDGTPRKFLDTSLAKKHGWVAKTDLETGFNKTYKEFIKKKLYLQVLTSFFKMNQTR